ncbi:MAG: hypothetical protein LBD40_03985 [Puniceicoccales bacterium]|jgi:hypothetical protein|nr:hypothetical protein [Puniceicoccales bacterium]
MQNFSQQCLDIARTILGHSLSSISEDGHIIPVDGEPSSGADAAHAIWAIGEYYRGTQEIWLHDFSLPKLAAQCMDFQTHAADHTDDRSLSYSALGLFCFGATQSRNHLWQSLSPEARELFIKQLTHSPSHKDSHAALAIARAVVCFCMGFTSKDETIHLVESFLGSISQTAPNGFIDHAPDEGIGGCYDIHGLWTLNLIQQVVQMHIHHDLAQHLLPSIRTHVESYLRLLPELIRSDGLAWTYGEHTGFYAQLLTLNALMLALAAGWIPHDRQSLYTHLVRRLFHCFFLHFVDQGHGSIVIRDLERTLSPSFSTRRANFDAVRYLCQWSMLAKKLLSLQLESQDDEEKTGGRFIQFLHTPKKEQGVFIYCNAEQKAHYALPLLSGCGKGSCENLAFPHCPGIFDAPIDTYLPILQPELTINGQLFIPSFYGKNCATGMGSRHSFFFRYEQPELISHQETIVSDLAHCRVTWIFSEDCITSEFIYTVANRLKVDQVRYVIALSAPHSLYGAHGLMLGAESLRAIVEKDDFGMAWKDLVTVHNDPQYRTAYGAIHFLQILSRTNPIFLLPGKPYHLKISFHPDIIHH